MGNDLNDDALDVFDDGMIGWLWDGWREVRLFLFGYPFLWVVGAIFFVFAFVFVFPMISFPSVRSAWIGDVNVSAR